MIAKFKVELLEEAAEFKKTDKTPQGEIEKAENIRRQYFNLKINRNEK